jgi:mono/diheme cytochrome c family protein
MSDPEEKEPSYRRIVACLVGSLLLGVLGCARTEPPRFTPSADVSALTADRDTEADKQRWQGLQHEIGQTLTKQCGSPLEPKALDGSGLVDDQLKLGAEIFARRCQPCHGTNGDGNGAVAKYLKPLPRDYTKGLFKFTSTPYGSKPRRSDLVRTLRRGVTGTSMPSFADLAPDDLEAVADYVIFLSQRGELEHELASIADQDESLNADAVDAAMKKVVGGWKEAQAKLVMPLTPMPEFAPESVAKGKALFISQACNKCHGLDGRGGLYGGIEVGKDVWGHEAAAADLTSGMFRGGGRPIDIYRRIYSGISGTPMPGFALVFAKSPDDIWYLVHFIRDMGERRRRNLPPLKPTASDAPPAAAPVKPPAVEPPASQPASKAAELRWPKDSPSVRFVAHSTPSSLVPAR